MIRKTRGKQEWCVYSHKKTKAGTYRCFGCYKTKEEAEKRLAQIMRFKHMR